PLTQWGGHGPPCASNETWSGGCQSRVAKTGTPAASAAAIQRLRTGTMASPSGTASAPPGQKSRWTSTRRRASPSRRASRDMELGGAEGERKVRDGRVPSGRHGCGDTEPTGEVRGASSGRVPRGFPPVLRPSTLVLPVSDLFDA